MKETNKFCFSEVVQMFDNTLTAEQVRNLKKAIVEICAVKGQGVIRQYRLMNSRNEKIIPPLLVNLVEVLGKSEKNLKKFYQIMADLVMEKGNK
jgi:hypothetical protein